MERKEYRSVGSIERRDASTRKVEGYAAVYGKRSHDLGGFVEVIADGAFDGTIEKSDVFALLNHDSSRGILARSRYGEGSLKLSIDKLGLKYEFEAPATALGDELLEMLTRGDIKESSFAFIVKSENITNEGDRVLRTITEFEELFDVSPVYCPAYPDTSVARRSIEMHKAKTVEPSYYDKFKKQIEE